MRYLNNKDLFKIMKMVKKANLKNRLNSLELPRDEEGRIAVSKEEQGTMLIFELIEIAPEIEKEIFEFLASIAEVKTEEMEKDEFDLLPKTIEHLGKQEKLINFFKQAFNSVN